jgi:hypothetical protein
MFIHSAIILLISYNCGKNILYFLIFDLIWPFRLLIARFLPAPTGNCQLGNINAQTYPYNIRQSQTFVSFCFIPFNRFIYHSIFDSSNIICYSEHIFISIILCLLFPVMFYLPELLLSVCCPIFW